jgi:hypothetical protein
MRTLAIAVGAVMAAATASASAQLYYGRTYADPYAPRVEYRDTVQECWNPSAGHFERVRPGEYQNDLDFRRCRLVGDAYVERYDRYADRYYDNRAYRSGEECWNPRAGHFEEVRPGERQDDLDFGRCRVNRWR